MIKSWPFDLWLQILSCLIAGKDSYWRGIPATPVHKRRTLFRRRRGTVQAIWPQQTWREVGNFWKCSTTTTWLPALLNSSRDLGSDHIISHESQWFFSWKDLLSSHCLIFLTSVIFFWFCRFWCTNSWLSSQNRSWCPEFRKKKKDLRVLIFTKEDGILVFTHWFFLGCRNLSFLSF